MPTLTGKYKELGTALLTWWTPQVSSLSLVSLDWQKGMTAQPAYPCNPVTQCPRAFLRAFRGDHARASKFGCGGTLARYVYNYSLWVQLQQTPGQDHQEILLDALALFRNPIIQQNFNPLNELGVAGVTLLDVTPLQEVVFDEVNHEFGHPDLRVSQGELNITFVGEVQAV